MSQQRGQTRIKPEFIDIKETLKKKIGTTADDETSAQAGPSNNPLSGEIAPKVSFNDYYLTFDTRACNNLNFAYGQFGFDLGPYLLQTNTTDFSLENVVELTITEPFFIPRLAVNSTFIFERVLLTIQELITSKGSSANVAPPYHFSLTVQDTGLGRFQLTPITSIYYALKPFRTQSLTFNFSTPVSYANYIPFPNPTVQVMYNSTTAFNTIFDNSAGAGFTVGDVVYFSCPNQAIQNDPANSAFFSSTGQIISAVIPLQMTISGAFNIVGAVPGTVFNVLLASRIIRIPFKIKTVRYGEGNSLIATSN